MMVKYFFAESFFIPASTRVAAIRRRILPQQFRFIYGVGWGESSDGIINGQQTVFVVAFSSIWFSASRNWC
jgi:hypothetical protein